MNVYLNKMVKYHATEFDCYFIQINFDFDLIFLKLYIASWEVYFVALVMIYKLHI